MRLFHFFLLAPIICFAQAPAPIISFNKTHHDFGSVGHNQRVSYKFKVTNTGSAPLQIKDIRTSCGCSYSVVGQWYLKPEENTFIEVHFNPDGMLGNIHKSLEVLSDDPANPNMRLTFEASVTREIMPSTKTAFFYKVPRNGSATTTIRLSSGDGQQIVVTDSKAPGAPYLSCTPQQDGRDVILNIKIDGPLIPKNRQHGVDVLSVRTTNKKAPLFQFNVQWDVQSAIMAIPEKISWHDTAGKELRANVQLKHPDGRAFRILEVKSSSSLIKIVNLSKISASEQTFDVVLSAKAKAGGLIEKLLLKLDASEQPEMEIGISAVLK